VIAARRDRTAWKHAAPPGKDAVPLPVRLTRRFWSPVAVVALLILAWWGVVSTLGIPYYICPTPLQVWRAFWATGWGYLPDVGTTTVEIVGGFAVALALALPLATVMNRWRAAREGLYPSLIFSQVVPIFVLAAIVTLVFVNDGQAPEIIVTAVYAFFPIVVTTTDGLARVDPELTSLLRSAGASQWRIFRTVRAPGALPATFSGAKLAIVFAVSGAAFSEWIGGQSGLGYRMRIDGNSFDMPSVFADAMVLTLLGVVMFGLLSAVEYIALPWNRGGVGEAGGLWRGR
jgi:NitT/TauT family transport system permease protein